MLRSFHTPTSHESLIGRRVGGYVIDSIIGMGGMGAVYGAYNALLGKRAAVKVLLGEYTEDRSSVERFFREARVIASLSDPNIIDIYDADVFADDGRMYILMPLIEGESLEALCLRTGPLPLNAAAAIILQAASGLDAVHDRAIIHRDVKTQNILITPRHHRKYFAIVVDFGIAKLLGPILMGGFRTRTRAMVGTAGSMAPEQARGERDVDVRADIYSLATVFYRMLTGRPPYEDATLYALIEKQLHNVPFPRPRELRSDIPKAWENVILAALEIDREKRPASMGEFARAITRAITNGDEMLRVLAPKLCSAARRRPTEPTLMGGVEAQLARTRGRSSISVPLALAIVIGGVGIGSVTMKLLAPHAAVQQVDAGAVAVARAIPSDAAPAPIIIDAPSPIIDAPPPDAQQSSGSGKVSALGTLVVTVKTHAEVYIDGRYIGTTPVHKTVAAGSHAVYIAGSAKEEVVSVKIVGGEESTVERSW